MADQGKEPVLHNEALEEAIKVFKGDQSNENLAKIMMQLERATVMQPAMLPKEADMQKVQSLIEKSQGGKVPVKLTGQTQPRPIILKNDKGDQFFAVFTSQSQMPADQKYPAMMFLPFKACSQMAAREELKLTGVVLNPFTDNLVIHKAALDMLNKKNGQILTEDKIARDGLSGNFYQDRQGFMEKIGKEKEGYVFDCYREAYKKEKGDQAPFQYRQEDFGVIILNISDTLHMARIGLAEGGAIKGVCLCAFCCYNPQTDEGIYYLIQRGPQKQRNRLLTVDGQGTCTDIGEAPEEGSELYELMGRVPWAEQ